jgi:hypothetical protein
MDSWREELKQNHTSAEYLTSERDVEINVLYEEIFVGLRVLKCSNPPSPRHYVKTDSLTGRPCGWGQGEEGDTYPVILKLDLCNPPGLSRHH